MPEKNSFRNPIFYQDEILQMLFWMRGEGLGEHVPLAVVNRFLTIGEPDLQEAIRKLKEKGLLRTTPHDDDRIRLSLTEQGVAEGKQRFKDEFDGFLGQESHMECDDPNCDCHDPEWEGVCAHATHEH